MKKLSIMMFAAAITTTLISCGDKEDKIEGSWKLSDLQAEYPKEMPDSSRIKEENELKGEIVEKKKISFNFKEDGTYSMGENTGTWKLNKEGTQLTITNSKKKEERIIDIIELSDSKFVGSTIDDGVKETYTLRK